MHSQFVLYYKDRADDEGKQEDKESGKEVSFYFRGLTPLVSAQKLYTEFLDSHDYKQLHTHYSK